MMVTDSIYENGSSTVKYNYASLILNATPILTLVYKGHRADLEQKYQRASWSKSNSRVSSQPSPDLAATFAPEEVSQRGRHGSGWAGIAAAGVGHSSARVTMQSQIWVFLKWLLRSCSQKFMEKEFNLKKFQSNWKTLNFPAKLKGSVTMAWNWNNILQKSNERWCWHSRVTWNRHLRQLPCPKLPLTKLNWAKNTAFLITEFIVFIPPHTIIDG